MEKKFFTTRTVLILSAIAVAAVMRLVPHWPNFTPVAAIALFGGAYINRKALAFLVPLAAMLISDLFLGFHSTLLAVYAAFIITVFIGLKLGKNVKAGNVALASVSSSVIFFLITNFASWMSGMMPYSPDFSGLMQAYAAGIPFFNNGLLGDLFYNTVLFGGFYLISRRYPSIVKA
ncbi:MAG: DUF6580 family putative transport protein [Lentimicrobium sp.]|jgi:hypothetical protein|nr:DUF6580 family putative transport protein [Lentimicrobium sp.]MEA5110940.1 DUF6580 family putative transport protein [Lentimicrobium sp.]